MKKITWINILLISIIFTSKVISQEYQRFLEEDKFWDVTTGEQGYICDGFSDILPKRYFVNGDTIINDTAYKKIDYFNFLRFDDNPSGCPPFEIDTISYHSDYYIREDVEAKRVYRYNHYHQMSELLFDFSLHVGDTLWVDPSIFGHVTIERIDTSERLDGTIEIEFFIEDFLGSYIEGIGGSQGPFEVPLNPFEPGYSLLCVKKDNVEIFGHHCYDFVTSTHTPIFQKTDIYPVPAKDFLIIEKADIGSCSVAIYSAVGENISNPVPSEGRIDISDLAPGYYLLTIKSGNENLTTPFIKR